LAVANIIDDRPRRMGAGVTGDRRDPKTDTSLDPGLQIPAIVRHTSLTKPGCRSLQMVE